QRQLEYDFVVKPNADPNAIRIQVSGSKKIDLDAATGDLIIRSNGSDVRLRKPSVFQVVSEGKRKIDAHLILQDTNEVSFALADYDNTKPLIIDPVISYATYLGGPGSDFGVGVATDPAGNVYVVGHTTSPSF